MRLLLGHWFVHKLLCVGKETLKEGMITKASDKKVLLVSVPPIIVVDEVSVLNNDFASRMDGLCTPLLGGKAVIAVLEDVQFSVRDSCRLTASSVYDCLEEVMFGLERYVLRCCVKRGKVGFG